MILFHDGLLIKSLYDMKENGTNAISVGFPINPYLRELRSKKSPFKENIFDCFASNPLGSYFLKTLGKLLLQDPLTNCIGYYGISQSNVIFMITQTKPNPYS